MSSPVLSPSGEDESVGSLSSSDSVQEDECRASSATPGASSHGTFQECWGDDANVAPKEKLAYLVMMMTTIDDEFNLQIILDHTHKNKKDFKPTHAMYKTELKRRDTGRKFGQVSNKTTLVMLAALTGPLKLTDSVDVAFVRARVLEHTNKVLNAAAKKSIAGSTRTQLRRNDILRFIECMVADHVKPLYLVKVNEVLRRFELDGRNSETVPADFYDVVAEQFNNAAFVPYSRVLPDLHEDYAVSFPLPFLDDYRMSPDRAKSLIASIKPRIAKLQANYDQSGNGDGMKGNQEDDDGSGSFALSNCIAGDNKRAFLVGPRGRDPSDLLYWWHVLEEEDMLQYTVSIFSTTVGVTSESVKSIVTSTSEKKGVSPSQAIASLSSELSNNLFAMSQVLAEDNTLKKQSIEMKGNQIMMQKMTKIREFEKEIEEMQDLMHDDANVNEAKKRRLEGRIDNLNDKIRILNNDDKGN